jgi:hypothetical protein
LIRANQNKTTSLYFPVTRERYVNRASLFSCNNSETSPQKKVILEGWFSSSVLIHHISKISDLCLFQFVHS